MWGGGENKWFNNDNGFGTIKSSNSQQGEWIIFEGGDFKREN